MARPARVPLRTRFARDVDPQAPWPEYPRPQLRRSRWQSLNGPWELAVQPAEAPAPEHYPHTIRVPFPIESTLGGVETRVSPDDRAWYRRRFVPPATAPDERLLLHFGAVDWSCEVSVDGRLVGRHEGGHLPFSFDVTDALAPGADHELVVVVHDPTDAGEQPVGKQSLDPKLIQYTAVTGIWQTVWLEPAPATRVLGLHSEANLAEETVRVHVRLTGWKPGDRVEASAGGATARIDADDACVLPLRIPGLRRWSPDDPFLYDLVVRVLRGDEELDRVDGYFGAREVGRARDANGSWRITLNGEPVFHLGLLDQGWWPDGLYTAPTDEALAFDIEATKRMGFNTIRKHVKVEPARWYWHADRLGVLVWQDMPSPRFDQASFVREIVAAGRRPQDAHYALQVSPACARVFGAELDAMLDALEPFACIVTWVPFNEAWGQHDTEAILARVARRDPTRLVDGPSGWKDTGHGQLRDHHLYNEERRYPGPEPDRPVVYGEFGGLGLRVDGHIAVDRGWGYRDLDGPPALETAYRELLDVIGSLVDRGLAAAIYTQTTDVESELNGLLSYDREVFKVAPEVLAEIHRRVLERS